MDIERLHHLAIICSDYERSKRFYTEVLGFTIVQENFQPRGSYKLDLAIAGQYQIELFSMPTPPPARPSRPEAAGLRHLALQVADVAAAKRELESKDIEVEDIRVDPYSGKRFTFFPDPDDLPIELYER